MSGGKIVLNKQGMLIVKRGRRQYLLSQNKQVKFRIRSFLWVGFPLSKNMHFFFFFLMGDPESLDELVVGVSVFARVNWCCAGGIGCQMCVQQERFHISFAKDKKKNTQITQIFFDDIHV